VTIIIYSSSICELEFVFDRFNLKFIHFNRSLIIMILLTKMEFEVYKSFPFIKFCQIYHWYYTVYMRVWKVEKRKWKIIICRNIIRLGINKFYCCKATGNPNHLKINIKWRRIILFMKIKLKNWNRLLCSMRNQRVLN